MDGLTQDGWTVVASRSRPEERYRWVVGFDRHAVMAAAADDAVILMHTTDGPATMLVARIAGPGWRRLQRHFAATPLPPRIHAVRRIA